MNKIILSLAISFLFYCGISIMPHDLAYALTISSSTPTVGPVVVNQGVFIPQTNDNHIVYLRYNGTNKNFRVHEVNLITGQKTLLSSIPPLQLPAPYTEQIVSIYGDNVAYFDTNTGEVWVLNTVTNSLQEVGTKAYSTTNPVQIKLFANYLLVISNSVLDVWNLNSNQAVTVASNCLSADINEATGQLTYLVLNNGAYIVNEANLSSILGSVSLINASSLGNTPVNLSPDGTILKAGAKGSVVTAAGTWTFSPTLSPFHEGNFILLNGSNAAAETWAAGVELLVCNHGQLYNLNALGTWYQWNGSSWNATIDPRIQGLAPKVIVPTVVFNQGNIAWTGFDNKHMLQVYFYNTASRVVKQLTAGASNHFALIATEGFLVWRTDDAAGNNIYAQSVTASGVMGSPINEGAAPSTSDSLSGFVDLDRIAYTINNVSASYLGTHTTAPMPMEQLLFKPLAATILTTPLNITISGTGMGTVTAYPASIQCSNDPSQLAIFCSGVFMKGESVTLHVIPSVGTVIGQITGISSTPIVSSSLNLSIPLTMNNGVSVNVRFVGPNPDPVVTAANWINYLGFIAPQYGFGSSVVQSIIPIVNNSVGVLSAAQKAQIIPLTSLVNFNLQNLLTPAELSDLTKSVYVPGSPAQFAASWYTIKNIYNYTVYGIAQSKIASYTTMALLGIAPTSSQMISIYNDMKAAVNFSVGVSETILKSQYKAFVDITDNMTNAIMQAIAFQGQIYDFLKNPPSYLDPILAPLDPFAMVSLTNDVVNQLSQLVKIFPSPSTLLTMAKLDPVLGPILAIPGVGSAIINIISNNINTIENISNDIFCFGFC